MIASSRYLPLLTGVMSDVSNGTAVQSHPGRWELDLPGSRVEARLVDSWLVMTSPVTLSCSPAQSLGWNANLPAWVKFALGANYKPQMRAEIPIDEDSEVGTSVSEVLRGFKAAHRILLGEAASPELSGELLQADLKGLCDESGWNSIPRDGNAVAVELECRGAFMQASLAACTHGLRAVVELAAIEEPECEALEAVGYFLLAAAREVRMARPALVPAGGRTTPRFEFVFSSVPTAAQLAHAFSALSVACQLCANEVRALRNPDVAGEFLALRVRLKTRAQSTTN